MSDYALLKEALPINQSAKNIIAGQHIPPRDAAVRIQTEGAETRRARLDTNRQDYGRKDET